MDYLQAIERPSVSILLCGQELKVRRANLGLHYRLSVILDQWQEARRSGDYKNSVALTLNYIALATDRDIECASLSEIMVSFFTLRNLNTPQDDLPFMRMKLRGRKLERNYDYEHRALADWVSRLSEHYGWTAHYVLNKLTPEETICHMQEALIHEYEEKEFLYRLSEVAYKIEGKGKSAKAKFVPFPKPGWMVEKPPAIQVPKKVWKAWVPQGNIIEAGDIGRAGN